MGLIGRLASVMRNPRKTFFGWWTVLATTIIGAWGWGSFFYGFGAYFKSLQGEFSWTRAETSAAYSLSRLEGGVEGPLGGMATDKYGPRIITFIGQFIAGLGLILMYFMNELWQFILLYGLVVSLGFNLGMMDPLDKAIADWFSKKRGLAMGIARIGLGVGGYLGPQFVTLLLLQRGWRASFVIAGLITWAIGLPLSWFCVKSKRPEYYGLMPDGADVDPKKAGDMDALIRAGQEYAARERGETEYTLRQAMRTRAFWVIVVSYMMISFIFPCTSVHAIPHITDMGVDPMAAAAALGSMVLVSAPSRFIMSYICDRIPNHAFRYIRILADSLRTLGLFLLMVSTNLQTVYLFSLVYGVGMGFSAGSIAPLRARFFGRKAFSTIHGTTSMLTMPASLIAPIYVGWVYDTTGSYTNAFTQAVIMGVIAVAAQFFLKPPKKIAEVSDVKAFL